mmetsp:Transcript_26264/g.36593  ORF Transcript_26264/g.36593 Transcript_26264/m.36593 type:complete len:348 (-) Transcript_26264:219-1262(-)|eukprot:CAMPEP_0184494794 /NCGR_PEP_ID=MMETSP0113_2-20130426/29590_1 /TAXON_ID=91329 /ORGANISM="Norrisiella sphaerica, Strain BC52" /LENGTH=347 /DNA_ID=CAMNT_0026880687 /DNA_START=61 /DNA_END=1104 /DNA_ORIENTATION=-
MNAYILLLIGALNVARGSELGFVSPSSPGRVELHIHLDGSVSVETLFEVAQSRKVDIPGVGVPKSPSDIWIALKNVTSIWQRFDVVNNIIGGDPGSLTRIAEAFVARQAAQGVAYTEVRYDPVRMATSDYTGLKIDEEQAVAAITDGLQKGAHRHGVSVFSLLCAMRGKPADACFSVASLAAKMRSYEMGGVVGLDLAGDEPNFDNAPYIECFKHAKEVLRLNTTCHAGEAVRPHDVLTAIEDMRVDRLGHGYAATSVPEVLLALQKSGVHLETCPPGANKKGVLSSIGVFRDLGLSFGLNEDDPTDYFENCTMASTEELVKQHLNFSDGDIQKARLDAFGARFGPH